MDKNQYKEMIAEYMRRESKLKEENTKLRIALCNLRDEFLDLGGDPKQLELFEIDNKLAERKLKIALNRAKERKVLLEKMSQQSASDQPSL